MTRRNTNLHSDPFKRTCILVLVTLLSLLTLGAGAQTARKSTAPVTRAKTFPTAQAAADALIDAAEKFDVAALREILGPAAQDIINTGEPVRDREQATEFAQRAREKATVAVDRKSKSRAFLSIGEEGWPFPLPIVKRANGGWFFDTVAGKQEILYRRVGRNELDAIEICHGFVEAQHEFALTKRQNAGVNQYAQRVISTPGKQDGLAWQNEDKTWDGPVGENVARAIEKGYEAKNQPFHGYVFKVLKGQGPAAPMGQMDFMVKGVMIGGFAILASPAEYGVTGIKTFMVSHDGVVYEKDLGRDTPKLFAQIDRFNPDKTWSPVTE